MVRKRNQAQAALHFYEERSRQELRNLINIVRKWAERGRKIARWTGSRHCGISPARAAAGIERENRRLNTGSIAFYAFPQYLVDMIVERTGGRPIAVALPSLVDGEVTIDEAGNVYLVDEVSDGAGSLVRRETLLLQVMGDGRLVTDNGRTYQVRPFAVQPGQAQVRDGRLEFPNTQQRPGDSGTEEATIDDYSRAGQSRGPPGGFSITVQPQPVDSISQGFAFGWMLTVT